MPGLHTTVRGLRDQGVSRAPRRVQGVRGRPKLTIINRQRQRIPAAQRLRDGRVDLYAGSCTSRVREAAAIHLGLPSPAGSSGLPAGSDGPSSNACANHHLTAVALLALLRVGFTEPSRSPGMLVGSYPAVSPLPRASGRSRPAAAVCFLWHFPAGHPGLPLTTTLPCGARTFLGRARGPDAAARSTRPSLHNVSADFHATFSTPWAGRDWSGELTPVPAMTTHCFESRDAGRR